MDTVRVLRDTIIGCDRALLLLDYACSDAHHGLGTTVSNAHAHACALSCLIHAVDAAYLNLLATVYGTPASQLL